MATESPLHMPGSYGSLIPPSLDSRSGSRPHLFSPSPQTPNLRRRQMTGEQPAFAGNKRSRQSYFDHEDGYTKASGCAQIDRFDGKSPAPFVNERYELAGGGGMETSWSYATGEAEDYFTLQRQRRGIWSLPTSPQLGTTDLALGNGPLESSPNGTKTWMLSQIFSIVGGVAGKLVQFCSVPFKGFQAGGGQGYDFDQQGRPTGSDIGVSHAFGQHESGRIPQDDYGVASMESLKDSRPTAKRLRTADNWVMVDRAGGADSRAASPRLSERRAPTPSQIPRPSPSRASSGRSVGSRPSLIPVSRRTSYARASNTGSPAAHPRKSLASERSYSRQSSGTPAMFQSKNSTSPLPPESQRLINKIQREDQEEDARMRRMSAQMQDMLREAQEALGSKFEIEGAHFDNDSDLDEGFQQSYK